MGRIVFFLALLAPFLFVFMSEGEAASFPCVKARLPDEKAICADAALSQQDDELANAFILAVRSLGKEKARAISKPLISQRHSCGINPQCISEIQARTIAALNEAANKGSEDPVTATGNQVSLPYGNKAGMTVTVLGQHSLNTEHATLDIQRTREDAKGYCRGYLQDNSEKCIAEELSQSFPPSVSANCQTGEFQTISGDLMNFKGKRTNPDQGANQYVILQADGEELDGSMASGYEISLQEFAALCPVSFAQSVADISPHIAETPAEITGKMEGQQLPDPASRRKAQLKSMWEASRQSPFGTVLLCYGNMADLWKARGQSKLRPQIWEAMFLAAGGNRRLSQLVYPICDEQIRAERFFNDDAPYVDAKKVFDKVAALMDMDIFRNCITDQCKTLAQKVLITQDGVAK